MYTFHHNGRCKREVEVANLSMYDFEQTIVKVVQKSNYFEGGEDENNSMFFCMESPLERWKRELHRI